MNDPRNQLAVSLAASLLGAGLAIVAGSAIVGLGSGVASASTAPDHLILPTSHFDAVAVIGKTAALDTIGMTPGTVKST